MTLENTNKRALFSSYESKRSELLSPSLALSRFNIYSSFIMAHEGRSCMHEPYVMFELSIMEGCSDGKALQSVSLSI
jgi:hypothetical protein